MELLSFRRSLFIINGVPMRRMAVKVSTHPPIPLEDRLQQVKHGLHCVSLMRVNGAMVGGEISGAIYRRKSGRPVFEYSWRRKQHR